jgi:hypothetical protein
LALDLQYTSRIGTFGAQRYFRIWQLSGGNTIDLATFSFLGFGWLFGFLTFVTFSGFAQDCWESRFANRLVVSE